MELIEEAGRRVALAARMKRVPIRWIADAAAAAVLPAGDTLHGIPLERGATRWELELIGARPE